MKFGNEKENLEKKELKVVSQDLEAELIMKVKYLTLDNLITSREPNKNLLEDVNYNCKFVLEIEDNKFKKNHTITCSFGILTPESIRKIAVGSNSMVLFGLLHRKIIVSYYNESSIREYLIDLIESIRKECSKNNDLRRALPNYFISIFKIDSIKDNTKQN